MQTDTQFDVIIIGGSFSGLAAGMALGRALRKVLIIDGGEPCNKQTPYSHNFLTQDGIAPREITSIARQQVEKYPTVKIINGLVVSAVKNKIGFKILTNEDEIFAAKKIVFATGVKDILPDIPGFAECWGISVLHCPYCHGYEVKGQKTGILGNSDYGFEFATLISNWTNDITLYTNGKSTLTHEQTEKLKKHHIMVVEDEIQQLDHTNGSIENIVFKNSNVAPIKALYSRRPFVQHSIIPELLGCQLSAEGYIEVNNQQKTTVQGVFACGDNTSRMRTVANAVAQGTTTGMMINKELIEESF